MSAPDTPNGAAVFGCAGAVLRAAERDFFRAVNPVGFILFARNCVDPAQLAALVAALRGAVGRDDAQILIDQEGGRVQRMGPPAWRAAPAPGAIAALDESRALDAAWTNARLTALELREVGIDVNCVPLLDIAQPDTTAAIGDRAFGTAVEPVVALGRAVCNGTLAGGVLPMVKHMPGHGRASVDSHVELPRVAAPMVELEAVDFAPFRALAEIPLGMTAHVLYEAIDTEWPGTLSPTVIGEVIRRRIGFDGLLFSDDISMEALPGGLGARARWARAAGCDVVVHCTGKLSEMKEIAAAAGSLSAVGHARLARALDRRATPASADRPALSRRLRDLLRG